MGGLGLRRARPGQDSSTFVGQPLANLKVLASPCASTPQSGAGRLLQHLTRCDICRTMLLSYALLAPSGAPRRVLAECSGRSTSSFSFLPLVVLLSGFSVSHRLPPPPQILLFRLSSAAPVWSRGKGRSSHPGLPFPRASPREQLEQLQPAR